ncbi:MAG: universal stress protein [Desulfobacterales bacterium]|jgi:nucleotide-binding universal stress UspA family protein
MENFEYSVLHPTDFSEASELAFAHALRLALLLGTKFTIFHSRDRKDTANNWHLFPAVRGTLERWGFLKKGMSRSAVFDELGIEIQKVGVSGLSPMAEIYNYTDSHPVDLIVLATHAHECLDWCIQGDDIEKLVRQLAKDTLFVPEGVKGFVSPKDGNVSLKNILIPVDREPHPESAIKDGAALAKAIGDDLINLSLIHVGNSEKMPVFNLPEDPRFRWNQVYRKGQVADEIIAVANEIYADLIVLPIHGRQGFLDVLRGSITKQVLQSSPCPVLAIADSSEDG